MKKYIVIGLLLVVIVVILVSCHDTGGRDKPVVSDTGQTTEAGPPSAETTSATAETATRETVDQASEVPTTYESGESGNETTEYVVNTEASENTTEGETEASSEPKPTEPKPTEPPHTHSWSGWNQSKAPTCTANGEEVRTCSCGAKESRTVNALGHNWSAWTQTKAPTCGAEGAEARSCSRCGVSESRSVPATGAHSWNEVAPTCTEAGSKTCSVCGKTESGAAALGHDWVHHGEEGWWQSVITCYCGAKFYSTQGVEGSAYNEWVIHSESFGRDHEDEHAGYNNHSQWIVDKPAYDSCSRCGATR